MVVEDSGIDVATAKCGCPEEGNNLQP